MNESTKDLSLHEKDTGSSEVQISELTKKIENLSKHIKICFNELVLHGFYWLHCRLLFSLSRKRTEMADYSLFNLYYSILDFKHHKDDCVDTGPWAEWPFK